MKLRSIIKSTLLFTLAMMCSSAMAQKDILLYQTDFTDWAAQEMTGSSDAINQNGFTYTGKPGIYPTTATSCGDMGYIASTNSTNYLQFPQFAFISGGVIEMEVCVGKNGRTLTLSQASGSASIGTVTASVPTSPAAGKPGDEEQVSGAQVKTGKDYGKYIIDFAFTGSGDITPYLTTSGKKGEIDISSMKVYTSVGTTPYVCSSDYPDAGADGTKTALGCRIQGAVGGAETSGTVGIKGYNLTSDVTFSIVGRDAAKFSLPVTTMSAADALAGAPVTVNFTPSVKSSVANAMLKISSTSNDYYVNLIGVTGSGTPEIVASTSLLNFWTSLIATTSQTLDVSGLNLTGPVTATLTGAGADRFTLSKSELTLAEAMNGSNLVITFTGDIQESELDASLVLSSPDAASDTVPLKGITSTLRPTMYPLEFDVDPAGTAYIETNPGGKIFKAGTQVTVKVTFETGYKVQRWQDASGNTSSSRVFTVSEAKNTESGDPITVFTVKGTQVEPGGDEPVEVAGLIALDASNVSTTSMTANWTQQDGNTAGYIVTVTDESGNTVATLTADAAATSIDITGLSEKTKYYYTVAGTGTEGAVTTTNVGPFETTSSIVKVCGTDDYND